MYTHTHTHGYFLQFFAPLPLHQEKATTATHTHKTTKQKHQSRLLAWATTSTTNFNSGTFHLHFYCKKSPSSVAKYHWWVVPQVSFLSWQNTSFVVTKVGSPQQNFCRNKIVFVVTKASLSRQNFWCDKIMFVVTKLLMRQNHVCRDKRHIGHDKTFVTTKWYLWKLPPVKAKKVQSAQCSMKWCSHGCSQPQRLALAVVPHQQPVNPSRKPASTNLVHSPWYTIILHVYHHTQV